MRKQPLPKSFLNRCKRVTAKRPRTVIDHILRHGFITTEELKNKYGYNHPPRAARDVREQGIPLETFRVTGSDGRKLAAYRFGDTDTVRFFKSQGRTSFSKRLKTRLIQEHGHLCAIYLEEFPERDLQIDHRIPYEVVGDTPRRSQRPADFMLLCGSANRAKSWSCEHCINWKELKRPEICRQCYWAFPEDYLHVAMRPVRRMDIMWTGSDILHYEELKRRAKDLQKKMPAFVKEIIRRYITE